MSDPATLIDTHGRTVRDLRMRRREASCSASAENRKGRTSTASDGQVICVRPDSKRSGSVAAAAASGPGHIPRQVR